MEHKDFPEKQLKAVKITTHKNLTTVYFVEINIKYNI